MKRLTAGIAVAGILALAGCSSGAGMVPVPKAPGVTSTTKAAATPTTKAPLITATCADVDAKYGSNLPPGYTLAQAETLLAQSCTPADLQSIVVAKGSTTAAAAVAVTYTESLICPANPGTKLCG